MTITDKEDLIINIEGKTQCISKQDVVKAVKYVLDGNLMKEEFKQGGVLRKNETFCAKYNRDNEESETIELSKDPIVNNVVKSFISRSNIGTLKYNTTLFENNLTKKEWLSHLQTELMDACNYIEKLKSIL